VPSLRRSLPGSGGIERPERRREGPSREAAVGQLDLKALASEAFLGAMKLRTFSKLKLTQRPELQFIERPACPWYLSPVRASFSFTRSRTSDSGQD
jgi:hypothetical protein